MERAGSGHSRQLPRGHVRQGVMARQPLTDRSASAKQSCNAEPLVLRARASKVHGQWSPDEEKLPHEARLVTG